MYRYLSFYRTAAVLSVAGILLLGVCFLHPLASESSYASDTQVSVSYTANDWAISAPTSTAADAGGITFDLDPSSAGVTAAAKDTVTAGATNVPNYQIYVSVDSTGGTIPSTSSEDAIAATSGTVTDATDDVSGAATLSTNSWGYALPSFSSANYDDLVSGSATNWNDSKWSKLPHATNVESDAAKIYDSTTGSGDSVDVYYAVNADNDLSSGEYQTTVTYTLIGEMPKTTLNSFDDAASDGSSLMQNVDTDTCTNTDLYSNTNKTYTLTDSRDNNTYKIRKLADGHCWMVTNLKLGKTSAMTLYNTDTDITDTSWNLPASTTITGDYNNAQMHIGTTSDSNWTSVYGNYYNWTAATAGKGTNSTSSGNIDISICPKGWKLPKGEANTVDYSWAKLYSAYNSSITYFHTATNTGTGYWSGYYYNGSLRDAGSYGYWRSRTVFDTVNAYFLYTGNSNVNPQNRTGTYVGLSVRCVLSSE